MILISLLSLGVKAQKKVIGSVAEIELPKGFKQLNGDNISFSSNTILTEEDVKYLPKSRTLYEKNDIIIGIWEVRQGVTKRSLEEIKGESIELYTMNKSIYEYINSYIETFNKMRYLILEIKDSDLLYYRIISEMNNERALNGFLKFRQEDKDKATNILKELLDHIAFMW